MWSGRGGFPIQPDDYTPVNTFNETGFFNTTEILTEVVKTKTYGLKKELLSFFKVYLFRVVPKFSLLLASVLDVHQIHKDLHFCEFTVKSNVLKTNTVITCSNLVM